MLRSILLILLICTASSQLAGAEMWDPSTSIVSIDPSAEGAVIHVVPDGSGSWFTEALDQFGNPVDATITLTVNDLSGDPIQGYPAEDIWLETSEGGLIACIAGAIADRDTDNAGQTVWQEPLLAGGCSAGEMVDIYVSGTPMLGPGLPLVFKSPDLSGDRIVNLTDVVAFTEALGGIGESCADFNNDGSVGLADVVRFTWGLGTVCP